jgi:hypothetical protein
MAVAQSCDTRFSAAVVCATEGKVMVPFGAAGKAA